MIIGATPVSIDFMTFRNTFLSVQAKVAEKIQLHTQEGADLLKGYQDATAMRKAWAENVDFAKIMTARQFLVAFDNQIAPFIRSDDTAGNVEVAKTQMRERVMRYQDEFGQEEFADLLQVLMVPFEAVSGEVSQDVRNSSKEEALKLMRVHQRMLVIGLRSHATSLPVGSEMRKKIRDHLDMLHELVKDAIDGFDQDAQAQGVVVRLDFPRGAGSKKIEGP